MTKFKITHETITQCDYCGYPLDLGDTAYETKAHDIVCSTLCESRLQDIIDWNYREVSQ